MSYTRLLYHIVFLTKHSKNRKHRCTVSTNGKRRRECRKVRRKRPKRKVLIRAGKTSYTARALYAIRAKVFFNI
jgi:hypothetical protein